MPTDNTQIAKMLGVDPSQIMPDTLTTADRITTTSTSAPVVTSTAHKLADKYNTIYFSGAQTEIWIGDNMLDEAIEIEGQYSMEEIPIYGYASTHFSSVAKGKVIVTGSLIINFKYDGYLYAHILAAMNKKKDRNSTLQNILNPTANTITTNNKQAISKPTDSTQGIDGEVTGVSQLFTDISSDAIKAYQDAYWNDSNVNPLNISPRKDFTGPFNIKIKDFKVGSNSDSDAQTKMLINCFINRYGTVRRVDGSPTVEIYQLIAQTLL